MTESNIEKVANKLQLLWFIVDSLKSGEYIDERLIDKAYNSLDEIKSLLYNCEKERHNVIGLIKELREEIQCLNKEVTQYNIGELLTKTALIERLENTLK